MVGKEEHFDPSAAPEDQPPNKEVYRRRDADSLFVIGCFFIVLAIAVLVGTHWAETERARVVNVVAGGLLLLIGLGAAGYGLAVKLKLKRRRRAKLQAALQAALVSKRREKQKERQREKRKQKRKRS